MEFKETLQQAILEHQVNADDYYKKLVERGVEILYLKRSFLLEQYLNIKLELNNSLKNTLQLKKDCEKLILASTFISEREFLPHLSNKVKNKLIDFLEENFEEDESLSL